MQKSIFTFFSASVFFCLGACEHVKVVKYALKQGFHQGALVLKAEEVDDLIRDPAVDQETKELLVLSQEVLSFASKDLEMKIGQSYRSYVDIKRPWVTQVVSAAYKDRLEEFKFKYPVVGALPYKGFFDLKEAQDFGHSLEQKDFDVSVRPVPAFSSLGWWPDPLMNTMLNDKLHLVELILHELVHLNFYFSSEADFNEAFASWFAFRATKRFIEQSPYFKDKNLYKKKLEKNIRFELRMASFIERSLEFGKSYYASKKNSPIGERRKGFFSWLKTEMSQEPLLRPYYSDKWNNHAFILSIATYYNLYQPIEDYAQKHSLNEVTFLKLVRKRGKKILKDIYLTK